MGVSAYLIGSVSQAMSPFLSLLSKGVRAVASCLLSHTEKFGSSSKALSQMIAQHDLATIQQWGQEAARRMNENGGRDNRTSFDKPTDEIDRHIAKARRGLERELELPVTLLMTGRDPDPKLYAEADRLKAERDWRLAVVPPLFAITIFFGLSQSCWWWLALIGVGVLLWQADTRNTAFRIVMIGAMQRGAARSLATDELKVWAESLPLSPLPLEPGPANRFRHPVWWALAAGRSPPATDLEVSR